MTAPLPNHDNRLQTDVYIKDYQGNIRAVYNQDDDCIVQQTDYYPYGLPKATSTGAEANPFKYGGKELNPHLPQPFYDFVARMQLPQLCLFQRPDPKASDYTWLNPFTYCAGDPINLVDPTGCSTMVTLEPDGRYKVVGGDLNDGDLRIYLVCIQEDGSRVKVGTVGVTPVITSFYDSDKGEWAKDSYIDPNDESGQRFLTEMTGENTPGVIDYAINARSKHKYDFKTTNGTDNYNASLDIYRGMPMGKTAAGETIYTSARDIGNIVAGYVAGANDISWTMTRLGFDAYQSYTAKTITTEGISSQSAQLYGHNKAKTTLSWGHRKFNFFKSIFCR